MVDLPGFAHGDGGFLRFLTPGVVMMAYQAIQTLIQSLVIVAIALVAGARFPRSVSGVGVTLLAAVLLTLTFSALSDAAAQRRPLSWARPSSVSATAEVWVLVWGFLPSSSWTLGSMLVGTRDLTAAPVPRRAIQAPVPAAPPAGARTRSRTAPARRDDPGGRGGPVPGVTIFGFPIPVGAVR